VNGRWAGVDPRTFESTAAPDVFIVGDANGSSVGKSGHFANSEGKLVAAAIGAQLAGEPENASPMLGNVCYSAITLESASWFTNHLIYSGGTMVPVPLSVAEGPPNGGQLRAHVRVGAQPLGGLADLMEGLHG
jgi:sulfide dehydrogenase [flavocytochrome c] flavoprotein subunit